MRMAAAAVVQARGNSFRLRCDRTITSQFRATLACFAYIYVYTQTDVHTLVLVCRLTCTASTISYVNIQLLVALKHSTLNDRNTGSFKRPPRLQANYLYDTQTTSRVLSKNTQLTRLVDGKRSEPSQPNRVAAAAAARDFNGVRM
ncbi:unnamed protein product [Trichogramma brassicae]|uniref:Uncharacterized protein n=1 Tax=Trichogramma brassicae TaxID=86971 RepID=A0A6H5IHK7_9HYME|nr:unnamed protein product [Trichogramma brassicae]